MTALSKWSKINITMTVVRDKDSGELTIINSVRLPAAGEEAVLALGPIKNIVRLGSFHGKYDSYYRNKFPDAKFYAMTKHKLDPDLVADYYMDGESPVLPLGATMIDVGIPDLPEACLVLPCAVLVVCDAVMNSVTMDYMGALNGPVLWMLGFKGRCVIGPDRKGGWMYELRQHGMDPKAVRKQFLTLLEQPFEVMVPGHGVPLRDNVHKSIRASLDKVLPAE